MNIWLNVVKTKVPAYVPVIFPVVKITRVSFIYTPDLFGCFCIPAKGCNSGRTVNGCIDAVFWLCFCMHYTVSIDKKVLYAKFLKDVVITGIVTAFRQPDAFRLSAHQLCVQVHGNTYLGPDTFSLYPYKGEISMGGATCYYL